MRKEGEVGMTVSEAILTLNANVVFACERAGFDSATTRMVEDALDTIEDALKAQEPRVMTWDELIATDHVYIETNKDWQKYIAPGIVTIARDTAVIASVRIGTRLIDGTIDKDVYGIECRCWTSLPTDAQREKEPWNG
jgi:hypothetical protein